MRRPHEAALGELKRVGTLIPAHHAGSSSPPCSLEPTGCSKPVQPSLLQEARAKLARPTVQSERPGQTAGAFAFRGVRTRFWDKGLRAWRSLAVGQRSGLAEVLADRRRRARGSSLRASRDLAPRQLCFTIPALEMRELRSNRGASGQPWMTRRPRKAEVSRDASGPARIGPTRARSRPLQSSEASRSNLSSETPHGLSAREPPGLTAPLPAPLSSA